MYDGYRFCFSGKIYGTATHTSAPGWDGGSPRRKEGAAGENRVDGYSGGFYVIEKEGAEPARSAMFVRSVLDPGKRLRVL